MRDRIARTRADAMALLGEWKESSCQLVAIVATSDGSTIGVEGRIKDLTEAGLTLLGQHGHLALFLPTAIFGLPSTVLSSIRRTIDLTGYEEAVELSLPN